MHKRIQIWHAIMIYFLLLVLIRFNEIIITLKMFVSFLLLIVSNPSEGVNLLTANIVDQFSAFAILLIGVFLTVISRKRTTWLNKKCSMNTSAAILLSFIFLFTPLLAPYNDNLQFNLPQAKRLAPLASRQLIEKVDLNSKGVGLNQLREGEKTLFREFVSSNYYLADELIDYKLTSGIKSTNVIFILGTDEYGRDILSRIIYATRYSLLISFLAIIISGILGIVLGFISGYFGKYLDLLLNRIVEIFLAIPYVFLVILCVAFLGDSLFTVIIVLGIAGWMSLFKVVRSEVLKLKTRDHIITSKMIGMSLFNLLSKEYLPLLMPSVIVNLTFQFAYILVAESSLSFLGVTGNYSHPSLGGMIQQGFLSISEAWWIAIFPTFVMVWIFYIVNNYAREARNSVANAIE